jgi:hypothetical protein
MSGVVTGELDSENPLTAAMDSVISVAAVISARVGAAGLASGAGRDEPAFGAPADGA